MSVLSGTDITVVDGIHGGYPIRLVVEVERLPADSWKAAREMLRDVFKAIVSTFGTSTDSGEY